MAISHATDILVVKNGNFTLLLTSHGQEWQFHMLLTSSGQEWQFHIATHIYGQEWLLISHIATDI